MIDLLQSDPVVLAIVAGIAWLALGVTAVRRARKGGQS